MTDYLHALPSGYRIEEYELVRVLGSGGFGITYLGYDHHLDKAVAIKEYLPNDLAVRTDNNSVLPKSTQDQADYEWGLERFLNEAQTLARFDHRHIIKIHRFFRAHGTGYSVMEYAEGETLSEVLQRKGTLTEAELKQLLFPILDGLEAVHEADFLHRDIKPGNIVIRDNGSPVLIDFGSARQAVAGKSRSVTAIVTPGYAPIEQYSVKGHQGPWTDIYGLGAVCYRCLTGEVPVDATERLREDPLVPATKQCKGKASAALLGAIDRALRVDERERPQTIAKWRKMLSDKTVTPAYRRRKDTAKPTVRPTSSPSQGSRDGLLSKLLPVVVMVLVGLQLVSDDAEKEIEHREALSPSGERITLTPFEPSVTDVQKSEEVETQETGPSAFSLTGFEEAELPTKDPPDLFAAYREGDVEREEAALTARAPALAQWSQLTLDIQTILMTLGYNPGTVDGIYGERTGAAIEEFQQDIGIPVDGQISQELLQTLQQSLRISQIFDELLDIDTNDNTQPTTSVDSSPGEKAGITDKAPTTQKSLSNITGSQEEYFTRGSHKDDVLRLQGTPSSINTHESLGHEIWYFRLSKVEIDLRTKRVLEWSNTSGNLKVRLLPGNQVTSEAYFTRGSHEDDVLRLQGTPSSINTYESLGHEIWYFGLSKVEIDLRTKRVLEWSNTSGNLKVRLLPGNQVTSEAYFTRGSHEDDVLRLQGTPSSINTYESLGHEIWYFGLSKVEIDLRTKRVLEWSNTSGNLKVKL